MMLWVECHAELGERESTRSVLMSAMLWRHIVMSLREEMKAEIRSDLIILGPGQDVLY